MKTMKAFEDTVSKETLGAFESLTRNEELAGRKDPAFGIDLGTTNSCIAVIQSGTTPRIVALEGGAETMPSCVQWKGKGREFIVGRQAYQERYKPNTIYSVKRLMGSGKIVILRYGQKELEMTPAEVSAEILKELVRQAKTSGHKTIKRVVITVPAYFDSQQVSDTIEAGKLAGLEVLSTLREPTAASLNYDLEATGEIEQNFLVFDLGGGTFDVSLLRATQSGDLSGLDSIYGDLSQDNSKSKIYTVLQTDGDSRLGGDDIDLELYKIVEERLSGRGIDVSKIPQVDKEKILLRLERLKKKPGSYGLQVRIKSKARGLDVREEIPLNLADFQAATRVIYRKARTKVNNVLAGFEGKKLNGVVLVGGSTKSEALRDMIRRDFKDIPVETALNPDESVATGAAIRAKELAFGDTSVQVFDVLPMSLGVWSDYGMKPILKRNSTVPCSARKLFTTVEDDVSDVDIHFYEGVSSRIDECRYLGSIKGASLPKLPAGRAGITVMMSVDSDGQVTVTVETEKGMQKVELVNIFVGKTETKKKLTSDERRVERWMTFAKTIGGEGEQDILAAIASWVDGTSAISSIAEVVAKYTRSEVKVTRPDVFVSDERLQ